MTPEIEFSMERPHTSRVWSLVLGLLALASACNGGSDEPSEVRPRASTSMHTTSLPPLECVSELDSADVTPGNVDTLCDGHKRLCIRGDMTVSRVADLGALTCLESVGGTLRIANTDAQTLEGLGTVTLVRDFVVENNSRLESLAGLGDLVVTGELAIEGNRNLQSLEGLEGADLYGLVLDELPALDSLEGFNDPRLGYLRITDAPSLRALHGLEVLEEAEWNVVLYDNPGLTSLEGLEGLRSVEDVVLLLEHSTVASLEPIRGLIDAEGDMIRVDVSCSASQTDLAGLEGLRSARQLTIGPCPGLQSLEALSGLETSHELTLKGLDVLPDLRGLEGLRTVDSRLVLESLPAITDLRGLDGLTTIGEQLLLDDNELLRSVHGLEALRIVGVLPTDTYYGVSFTAVYVRRNPVLDDLSGLHGLELVHDGMSFYDNDSLTQEEIRALVDAIDELNGGYVAAGNKTY